MSLLANADLLLRAQPLLGTPALARAVAHYQQRLGFRLLRHIPGVMAQLELGGLRVQLWQRGTPGLGSHTPERDHAHAPERARAAVPDVFALHALLARQARPALSGTPTLQAWGAWECVLTDGDGNRLHLVQWPRPLPAPSPTVHTDPAARPAPRDGR